VTAADAFCDLLRARLSIAQHQYPDLALKGPAYRLDPLFELAADYAEVLGLYGQGKVGASTVREYALKVAALSAVTYWATVPDGGAEGVPGGEVQNGR